jgi:hypothetical protein
MKSSLSIVVPLTLLVGLAACGTSPGDRAVTGAIGGAATGAAVGALVGNPAAGAAIGGLAGGVAGAVTSPNDVYLGRPAWER